MPCSVLPYSALLCPSLYCPALSFPILSCSALSRLPYHPLFLKLLLTCPILLYIDTGCCPTLSYPCPTLPCPFLFDPCLATLTYSYPVLPHLTCSALSLPHALKHYCPSSPLPALHNTTLFCPSLPYSILPFSLQLSIVLAKFSTLASFPSYRSPFIVL